MKSFIGKDSLKDAMGLMKKDLSKKEDIVSDFTDAQVAEMYGSTSGGLQDVFQLLLFGKQGDQYFDVSNGSSNVKGKLLNYYSNSDADEVNANYPFRIISKSEFSNVDRYYFSKYLSEEIKIQRPGCAVFMLIPKGILHFKIGVYISSTNSTAINSDDNYVALDIKRPGFLQNVPLVAEGYSYDLYLV